jgi:four helix bundle protein
MNTTFDHEKLQVDQRSIESVAWVTPILEQLPPRLSVVNQLDRASTSIPLNIAGGNAKHSAPDRCRYFDTARGSALECAASLDVRVAKGKSAPEEVQPGKQLLVEVVSMLIGLIKSIDPDRLREEPVSYGTPSAG